eukprot:scaffold941_cov37-Tisochrysis_lutea.AAC.3
MFCMMHDAWIGREERGTGRVTGSGAGRKHTDWHWRAVSWHGNGGRVAGRGTESREVTQSHMGHGVRPGDDRGEQEARTRHHTKINGQVSQSAVIYQHKLSVLTDYR